MSRDYLGFVVETEHGFQVENGYGDVLCGPSPDLAQVKEWADDLGVTLVPAEPSGTVRAIREARRPK